ncbi:MAG: TetR/AcrR family transcriptional regulator [Acidobacteriaceae bacterium]|nr:TetR/AcrR family transcriptional regulator [Acidobacteriaceae bacterium]
MSAAIKKNDNKQITPNGRGRPRDQIARKRILESALELVEELGCADATTDAIADRAGASKATIYRWWPNKAAVLIEALRARVAEEMPFPDTGDLNKDVRLQLQNFIKLLSSGRGGVFKAFLAAAQSDAEMAEAFRSVWIQPRRTEAMSVLRRHQANGSLRRDADLASVLDLMYGPIYFRLLAGHAPLTLEFANEIADLTLPAIGRIP